MKRHRAPWWAVSIAWIWSVEKWLKAVRKNLIFRSFGKHCAYCGTLLTVRASTLDHVVPKVRGGEDGIKNILLACGPCNGRKGELNVMAFRKKYIGRNGKFFFESGLPVRIGPDVFRGQDEEPRNVILRDILRKNGVLKDRER